MTSFSDLAEEWYIDSFVIDTSIAKLIEEARAIGKDDTLCFPLKVYEWITTSNKVFKQEKLTSPYAKPLGSSLS